MGTITATTIVQNIRDLYLGESVESSQLTSASAGVEFLNSQILVKINQAKNRLWDIINRANENYFMVTGDTSSLALVASTKEYTLPARFWRLTGLKVTTAGYEHVQFKALKTSDAEFKLRDAIPSIENPDRRELGYCIVDSLTFKLCDFPPAALATSLDYIESLPDYALSGSSTVDLPDLWIEFIEKKAAFDLLIKKPEDKRRRELAAELRDMRPDIINSVSRRQIRDPIYVQPY